MLQNPDDIRPLVWNILQHIFSGERFDIVHCILEEMARSSAELQKSIYYAPYIMRIILAETDFQGALTVSLKVYTPREKQRIYHPEDATRFFQQQQQGQQADPDAQGQQGPGGQFQQQQWPPQGFVPPAEGQPPYPYGIPQQFYDPFMTSMVQRMESLTTGFEQFQTDMRSGFQSLGSQFTAFDSRLSHIEDRQGQFQDSQTQQGDMLREIQDAVRPVTYRRRFGRRDGSSSSRGPPPPQS